MTQQERLEREWLILLQEEDWASAVKRRLGELGKTQEDLARAIGVPLNRVHRHLNGVGAPKVQEARAIAGVLADWAKLAYLSLHRLGDVLRPRWSPRLAFAA